MIKRPPLSRRLRNRVDRLAVLARHPKRVTCLECGFLSLGEAEVTKAERRMLASRGVGSCPPLDVIRCSRALWVDYDLMYAGTDSDGIFDELEADRRGCEGFLRHEPGWTPNEHRELLKKVLENRRKIVLVLLAAVTGSITGLLGAWVAKILGLG